MPNAAALIGVGVVLLDPAKRLLLGWRVKVGEQPSWCLPGGLVEHGETPAAAAARELAEETGISTTDPLRAFGLVWNQLDSHVQLTIGYECHPADAQPERRELDRFERWAWFNLAHPPEPLFPASQMLLDLRKGITPLSAAAYRITDLNGD